MPTDQLLSGSGRRVGYCLYQSVKILLLVNGIIVLLFLASATSENSFLSIWVNLNLSWIKLSCRLKINNCNIQLTGTVDEIYLFTGLTFQKTKRECLNSRFVSGIRINEGGSLVFDVGFILIVCRGFKHSTGTEVPHIMSNCHLLLLVLKHDSCDCFYNTADGHC